MIGRRETSCAYVGGGDQTRFIVDAAGVNHKGEYYLCQNQYLSTDNSTKDKHENTADDKADNDSEKPSSYDVV